jgi:pyroglutamyl-peptidase
MLGLRRDGTTIEIEILARNQVGDGPDARGKTLGPGPIEPGGPETLASTLFRKSTDARLTISDDAGCYLCNYVYYRALRLLPHKQIGFVHVPPQELLPVEVQRSELALLLDAIENR